MAELFIDTGAVCRNYQHYTKLGFTIPVLKDNGYGLGAKKLLKLLQGEGVTLFACSRTEEALELSGMGADIMLLGCEHDPVLLRQLVQRNVIIAVESLDQAKMIHGFGIPARIQIAVDTGLGRFGFLPKDIEDMKAVFNLEDMTVFGIFSHLADTGKEAQLDRFHQVLAQLEGYPVGLRHIASTHSAESSQYRLDALRVGSGLTGLVSGLEPAAAFTARICTIRDMKKGTPVSYSGVKLKRDSKVAIIDVGTGDGAFTYRSSGPRTWLAARKQSVTIGGHTAYLIGYPGLTHTAIDVTDIPCKVGDLVTVKQSPVMISGHVRRKYSDE